jgi:hypothetical protein
VRGQDQKTSAARDGASAASTGAPTAAAMDVDDCAASPPSARETRVPARTTGRAFPVDSDSPSVSDSDDGWVRGRRRLGTEPVQVRP